MGDFWSEAKGSAAREFGARHYRAFAFLAYGRRLLPVVLGLCIAAFAVMTAAGAVKRWDDWSPWIPIVVTWMAVAAGVALPVAFAVWLWRNRWRWQRW